MLSTIAMLVLLCSILTMFSQEVANIVKKIASIPGVIWIVPLIIASALMVYGEAWIIWIFLNFKRGLHVIALQLATWFPGEQRILLPFMNCFILIFCSTLPLLLAQFWKRKRVDLPLRHVYFASLIIWVLVSILLTVSYSYSLGGGLAE